LIDRKKSKANPGTSARGKRGLARLPADSIPRIESEIEERFRDWAMQLVADERWNRYRGALSQPGAASGNLRTPGLLNLIREFSYDYTKLLENAVVEFVKELAGALLKSTIPTKEIEWQEILDTSFRFADRFTRNEYAKPWEGIFVLHPRPTDPLSKLPLSSSYLPDKRAVQVDFQRMNVLAGLATEAEMMASSEKVMVQFYQEIRSSEWKSHAGNRAQNQFRYAYSAAANRAVGTELTERERKILVVIRLRSKGMQYCRELENAGIRPRKTGAWKDSPGTYPTAYQAGEPWRHRIQDEKSKIGRKAGSQGLAGE
jgi:hypothetical protein